MYLLLERIESIEARALAARSALGLDGLGQRGFDVVQIAIQATGGAVVPEPNLRLGSERVSGLLERNLPQTRLSFELYEPPYRQRFTVAHELGHYFLDEPLPAACSPGQVDPPDDVEEAYHNDREEAADAFAAAFLIPATSLREDVQRFGRSAAFLAQMYCVTQPAMRRDFGFWSV